MKLMVRPLGVRLFSQVLGVSLPGQQKIRSRENAVPTSYVASAPAPAALDRASPDRNRLPSGTAAKAAVENA